MYGIILCVHANAKSQFITLNVCNIYQNSNIILYLQVMDKVARNVIHQLEIYVFRLLLYNLLEQPHSITQPKSVV